MQLRYGEPTLRRAVPLALALISVSNPRLNILDTLSKFSHDADPEVSYNSIFAMGMVGSGKPGDSLVRGLFWGKVGDPCLVHYSACTSLSPGTNNARLAAMLRQLAQYHAKDPNNLFMVRLAQVMILCSLLMCGRGSLGPCLGCGRRVVSWGCYPPEGRAGSPGLLHRSFMCFLCHTRA